MDQVTPRDLRTRGRRPSRTATAGVFRASDGSGTHVPRRSAGRCGMEVWLRRAEPSSELGYYERRAGRRRTSGWCTWQSLQRELVCGSGAAACAAQTTSPASQPVQPGPSPSSASARGRAVDSGPGCPAGRAAGVKRLTSSSPTGHPPHPASTRSRASSDLNAGKAARRRRQRGRSGRRQRSRGATRCPTIRIKINAESE